MRNSEQWPSLNVKPVELTILLVTAEKHVESLEIGSAVEMGSLGDEDLLDRLGVVDDDALWRAESDAENVAVFLLKKEKRDLNTGHISTT